MVLTNVLLGHRQPSSSSYLQKCSFEAILTLLLLFLLSWVSTILGIILTVIFPFVFLSGLLLLFLLHLSLLSCGGGPLIGREACISGRLLLLVLLLFLLFVLIKLKV